MTALLLSLLLAQTADAGRPSPPPPPPTAEESVASSLPSLVGLRLGPFWADEDTNGFRGLVVGAALERDLFAGAYAALRLGLYLDAGGIDLKEFDSRLMQFGKFVNASAFAGARLFPSERVGVVLGYRLGWGFFDTLGPGAAPSTGSERFVGFLSAVEVAGGPRWLVALHFELRGFDWVEWNFGPEPSGTWAFSLGPKLRF